MFYAWHQLFVSAHSICLCSHYGTAILQKSVIFCDDRYLCRKWIERSSYLLHHECNRTRTKFKNDRNRKRKTVFFFVSNFKFWTQEFMGIGRLSLFILSPSHSNLNCTLHTNWIKCYAYSLCSCWFYFMNENHLHEFRVSAKYQIRMYAIGIAESTRKWLCFNCWPMFSESFEYSWLLVFVDVPGLAWVKNGIMTMMAMKMRSPYRTIYTSTYVRR